ncbi:38035_t:CDS:1 [Gigaspora margarita]|uniref:38035_t:CDS:1 n=1 Tax=Gigaspora margarita TaxID=4874 RepID=A0ABN7VLI4_GIGMA|nr:38035_t:CDS:1 [Gigaspora margarita]
MHITEGHELNKIEPGYRSQSDSKYSKIESTPSLAIMSLYQKLFSNSNPKFSGPYILGWDENKLLEASLKGIQFCPFAIKVGNLIVYITSLGIKSNINIIGASVGYISSFISEFKKKRALFVQAIEKDNCKITIYISKNESIVVLGKMPDNTWKNIGLYKKFYGTQLFGLDIQCPKKLLVIRMY